MSQPLAFSMIFRVIDDASSGIRRIGETLKAPAAAIGNIAKAAGEASQKFANSFTGMGAIVAEGFSVRAVAAQEEFYRRMQINSGMTDDSIAKLKHTMEDATSAARISGGQMMEAFKSFKGNGGGTEVFEETAQTMASAIQLLNGHGEELGEMFANLQTKMGLTKGEEFLSFLATAKKQLAGIDGGIDNFASSSQLLMSSYAKLGHTGQGAAQELSAVYAIIARGTGSAKQAKGHTEALLQNLGDLGFQQHLAGAGVQVWNNPTDPRSGVRGVTDIIKQIAEKYAADPHQAEMFFGKDMGEALKVPIAEIKNSGHSETLEKTLGAQGNGAEFMKKAQLASQGLSGSLNALQNAVHHVAEENLAGPIILFAKVLSACTGPIAYVLMGMAGLAALGHAVGWIAGAVKGFQAFAQVLSLLRLGSLVTGLWSMIPALGGAIAATWAWTVALLACPITWIILGIMALAGAVYLIYQNWDGISAWFSAKWDAVKAAFDQGFGQGVIKLLAEFNPTSLLMDAMNDLVKWLTGFDLADAGKKLIGSLIKGIKGVVDLLPESVQRMLGLDGLSTSSAPPPAPPAAEPSGGGVWSRIKSGVGAASDAVSGGYHKAVDWVGGKLSGTAKEAMAFFEKQGWSHEQAAGIAANLAQESGFKANAVGDNGKAYGIGQWHPDRQAKFAQWSGKDIRQSTLEDQLAFVHHELTEGSENRAGNVLAQATSAADAGAIVSKLYERPADREGEASRRGASADALARANDGAPVSAMSPPATPAEPRSAFASAAPAQTKLDGTIRLEIAGLPAGVTAKATSTNPGVSVALGMGPVMS